MLYLGAGASEMLLHDDKSILCLRRLDLLGPPRGAREVEFAFLPGSASDVRGLEVLPLSLPAGSELFMDSG